MRRYLISWRGFGPEEFVAETASKARYKAFMALKDAGILRDFQQFVEGVYVLHLGKAAA